MEAFVTVISPGALEADRERLSRDLRTYCGVDTLAMVETYGRLVAAADEACNLT